MLKNPEKAAINHEIDKLLEAGYAKNPVEVVQTQESAWYIPHHLVEHNGKHHLVSICSFHHQGQVLNKSSSWCSFRSFLDGCLAALLSAFCCNFR